MMRRAVVQTLRPLHRLHARPSHSVPPPHPRHTSTTPAAAPTAAATSPPSTPDASPASLPLGRDGVPLDSLPRYPTLTTQGSLRFLDYLGTVSFANSGAFLAAAHGMDLFGACMVGTITAVGGGTIRDAVILGKPPFWTEENEYIYLSLLAATATFLFYQTNPPSLDRPDLIPEVTADAAGVAAFCVIGAQNAVRAKVPMLIGIICGMSTATFGGVVRDVLCQRPVRILHSTAEIYASTAAAGAAAYLVARRVRAGVFARVGVGLGVAGALRMWAWKEGIRLPVWDQTSVQTGHNDSLDSNALKA